MLVSHVTALSQGIKMNACPHASTSSQPGGTPRPAISPRSLMLPPSSSSKDRLRDPVHRQSDDLPTVIEGVRLAKIFAQRTEVDDFTVLPKNSVACRETRHRIDST